MSDWYARMDSAAILLLHINTHVDVGIAVGKVRLG